jgi:hypothetical protein
MFRSTSRYANQPTSTWVDVEGRVRPYVLLREVPPPPTPSGADPVHVVVDHDRLDRISWKQLGDPELFWRVCDANGALAPEELVAVVGRRLIVPLDPGAPQP